MIADTSVHVCPAPMDCTYSLATPFQYKQIDPRTGFSTHKFKRTNAALNLDVLISLPQVTYKCNSEQYTLRIRRTRKIQDSVTSQFHTLPGSFMHAGSELQLPR